MAYTAPIGSFSRAVAVSLEDLVLKLEQRPNPGIFKLTANHLQIIDTLEREEKHETSCPDRK